MPLKQMNFENSLAKVDDEQFLSNFFPKCFQFYLTIKLSAMEIFQMFANILCKSAAADLLTLSLIRQFCSRRL